MKALLLVDIQYDFLPGGALAVPHGDAVLPVALRSLPLFDLVVATQDWHPANHLSFASQHPGKRIGDVIELEGLTQVLWPDHCIQGSRGSALHDHLPREHIDKVIQKGTDRNIDSYSGFFDNGHRKATGLEQYLRSQKVDEVHVLGLATDYCVKFTALDAAELGFRTSLITDGVRGVELNSGDCAQALDELRARGVQMV
jgi:nicotinamidase/pyrazinamidase